MAEPSLCAAPGCSKPARQNRYSACSMHEARMRRGGSFEPRQPPRSLEELLGGITRFGCWQVLGEGEPYLRPKSGAPSQNCGRQRTALCRCVCGTERAIAIHSLKQNHTRSCGCQMAIINPVLHGTHMLSHTAEYKAWSNLKGRCFNPSDNSYSDYGGRGVTVCERWKDSFETFYADMGPRPSDLHSIDRIDVNGNYEPGNCRWATQTEQMQNVRNNVIVRFRGEDMALIAACRKAGLSREKYKVIHARMRKGMTFTQAIAKEGIAA